MPSIVTHYLFAKDVLNHNNLKEKVSISHYLIFAQSFDNLFYYKFLTPWQGKEIRDFGEDAQTEKVNLYFENILDYITDHHLEKDKEVLSYFYGSLCHYMLDSHCHPFVIYHAGLPLLNKKYRGRHEKIEVGLDAYMYQKKTNKDLYKERIANTLLPKIKFSQELKDTMDNVFKKTFSKEDIGTIYEQSTHTGNLLLKVGVTDRTGLKKALYTIKDVLIPHKKRKYQYLSFHVTKIEPELANVNHNVWYHPVTKDKSTKSFEDLYNDALKKTENIINETEKYFKKQISKEELLSLIGNNSYTTGLPCDNINEMKYFKD